MNKKGVQRAPQSAILPVFSWSLLKSATNGLNLNQCFTTSEVDSERIGLSGNPEAPCTYIS